MYDNICEQVRGEPAYHGRNAVVRERAACVTGEPKLNLCTYVDFSCASSSDGSLRSSHGDLSRIIRASVASFHFARAHFFTGPLARQSPRCMADFPTLCKPCTMCGVAHQVLALLTEYRKHTNLKILGLLNAAGNHGIKLLSNHITSCELRDNLWDPIRHVCSEYSRSPRAQVSVETLRAI